MAPGMLNEFNKRREEVGWRDTTPLSQDQQQGGRRKQKMVVQVHKKRLIGGRKRKPVIQRESIQKKARGLERSNHTNNRVFFCH